MYLKDYGLSIEVFNTVFSYNLETLRACVSSFVKEAFSYRHSVPVGVLYLDIILHSQERILYAEWDHMDRLCVMLYDDHKGLGQKRVELENSSAADEICEFIEMVVAVYEI